MGCVGCKRNEGKTEDDPLERGLGDQMEVWFREYRELALGGLLLDSFKIGAYFLGECTRKCF